MVEAGGGGGGKPAMDYYPVEGGVVILLGMLHATETGKSSNRLGLWLIWPSPYLYYKGCRFCRRLKAGLIMGS